MANDALLRRITSSPQTFDGKPGIRGMRIPVERILGLLAQGETYDSIFRNFPELESDDIRACIEYARVAVAGDSFDSVQVAGAR